MLINRATEQYILALRRAPALLLTTAVRRTVNLPSFRSSYSAAVCACVSAVRDAGVAGRVRHPDHHHQCLLHHHHLGDLSQGGATASGAHSALVGVQ